MKINSELERVGDQAVNIYENTQLLLQQPPLKPLIDLPLMAQIAQHMLRESLDAFTERDPIQAEAVIMEDDRVDALKDQVFREVLTYMMSDPSTISRGITLILISRNLERIGDQAVNIAENTERLLQDPPLKPLIDLPIMAEHALKMVRESLESFIKRDPIEAKAVIMEDDRVDDLKDQIFRELLTYMMSDPSTIPRALSLILISRNLERIGDQATNIAEEVIYMVEGKDVRHPKKA
jgi:phosphate transport system protein